MGDALNIRVNGAIPSVTEAPDLKKSRRQKNVSTAPDIDRLPPHAEESEQGVLGCILLSPNECIGECIEKFGSHHVEVFYDLRHQTLFDTLVEMFDKREPIDVISFHRKLKDKQILDQVGGIAYISNLPMAVPSAANLDYYMEKVWEKYQLRKLIQSCTESVSRIYEFTGEFNELMETCERDFTKTFSINNAAQKQISIKEAVKAAISTIEKLHANQGSLGIPSGLKDYDRLTCGLHNAEMIVIAARPSMGKTSLAMGIAEHVAIECKLPVGVFSLEMSTESLVLRMLCSRARVDSQRVRKGYLIQEDFTKLAVAAGHIANAPIHIDDTPALTTVALRSKARRMHEMHGVKLFVIDYLQLLHTSSKRTTNREQAVAEISNSVKAMAKELNVPVIVLSQLNRDIEKNAPKGKKAAPRKPRMSDLRESGAIEQDADLIGLLWKPGADDASEEEESASEVVPVQLVVAKQRNGPTGDIDLIFNKPYTRFENAAVGGPID